jgi:hypothetical protein
MSSSSSTISSDDSQMSTDLIQPKPVYNLIELDLEEYEENELVLNTIHELKVFFEESENCTCRRTKKQKDIRTCFEKVGFKRFFERHFELKGLEKVELELFIKSQLMSFEITNEKNNNDSQRHHYKYNFNSSLPLCKPTYLKLCGVSEFVFLSIQTHFQTDGLKERIHGNTGHAKRRDSKVYLDLELTSQVKEYLI